jgi:hypothetical protein
MPKIEVRKLSKVFGPSAKRYLMSLRKTSTSRMYLLKPNMQLVFTTPASMSKKVKYLLLSACRAVVNQP